LSQNGFFDQPKSRRMRGGAGRPGPERDFHIRVELAENGDHAFEGETAPLRIADARKFGV